MSQDKTIFTAIQSSAGSELGINLFLLTGELLFDKSLSLEHWFNTRE